VTYVDRDRDGVRWSHVVIVLPAPGGATRVVAMVGLEGRHAGQIYSNVGLGFFSIVWSDVEFTPGFPQCMLYRGYICIFKHFIDLAVQLQPFYYCTFLDLTEGI
jgi:hypothetical protein